MQSSLLGFVLSIHVGKRWISVKIQPCALMTLLARYKVRARYACHVWVSGVMRAIRRINHMACEW